MSTIFSIDPGKNGAVVFWSNGEMISINNLAYEGTKISLQWLKEIFENCKPKTLVIENVHTSPRMGVVSAGNFMYNLGAIHSAATMAGTEIVMLTPQKWKAVVGLYGKHKGAALIKARELFPSDWLSKIENRKNSIDRAEAALIGVAYAKIQEYKK